MKNGYFFDRYEDKNQLLALLSIAPKSVREKIKEDIKERYPILDDFTCYDKFFALEEESEMLKMLDKSADFKNSILDSLLKNEDILISNCMEKFFSLEIRNILYYSMILKKKELKETKKTYAYLGDIINKISFIEKKVSKLMKSIENLVTK